MKRYRLFLLGAVIAAAQPRVARAEGWTLNPAVEGQQLKLSYTPNEGPSYLFECGTDVRITERGVTGLLDIRTNKKIDDTPGSTITPGAALMALYTGKGEPNLIPAVASPNSVRGWDLTIRLSKDDRNFRGLAKAEMISLFTTGYTMAVAMSSDDRKLAADFVNRCRSAAG